MKTSRRLLLVVGVALAVGFAPVPPPRTGVAEAVVTAIGGGPKGVRQFLLAALPHLLQAERVKKLACLKGETNPAAWLGKQLRVEEVAPGGPVRLRLGGCRPNEALALLTLLVEAYEVGNRRTARMYEMELIAAVQAQAGQGGVAPVLRFDRAVSVGRRDSPTVLQRPKLVSTGASR